MIRANLFIAAVFACCMFSSDASAALRDPAALVRVKGGLLDGRAGWHYALQRAYAEVLLALHLHEPPPDGGDRASADTTPSTSRG